MNIATLLGLDIEIFCRMSAKTKMLFSNILGHAAELHYEKYLDKNRIEYEKAPTDVHYDFIINEERHQVKRFETATTDRDFVGVNLTKTHGDRSGPDAFYERTDFDKLVLFDVGFREPMITTVSDLPRNRRYNDRLPRKFKIPRTLALNKIDIEFLKILKKKNVGFPKAIESFRKKQGLKYRELLEQSCNLSLKEIDSLFSDENFRLVTGVKGFAAEEHFNALLDKHSIPYYQNPEMYSKVDHWVKRKIRVQVKTLHGKSTDSQYWGVKLHKSHGHGVGELCPADAFDVLALFVGFKMDETKSKYFPIEVENKFVFIPISDLPRHPKYTKHLKRIAKIEKGKLKTNDLTIFEMMKSKKRGLEAFFR